MLADVFKLTGKVAIVTGSGRGIGQCIGLTFAEAGADVVFSARTQGDIDASVARAEAFGVRALAVRCDVTEEDQLRTLVERTVQTFGRIDILVNNAGGGIPRTIPDIETGQFLREFQFCVVSAFSLTRMCLPYLRQTKGAVINNSSSAGHLVHPWNTNHGTVKAGLEFMTKLLAAELAPDVRVNVISPGFILSDGMRKFLPRETLERVPDLIPLKQFGTVEDVAWGALYLASPAARWVTGKVLEIDGGTFAAVRPEGWAQAVRQAPNVARRSTNS